MCGIAGFTRFHRATGDISTLEMMGQSILHRGPDAGGTYLDDGVGLCHRRLSIIDLSSAGNQPMFSADRRFVIVFNGEIYNFLPLREQLAIAGYPFKSRTDTEVLLALYQRDGEKMVEHINGMFAFALWDRQEQTLFMARDRLGKKPLYYYHRDDYFVFASEIKAILQLPIVRREIRPDAVYDYFTYQYVPDPKSIFRDIHKLAPGHTLTINRHGHTTRQYWDLSFAQQRNDAPEQIADQLFELTSNCVQSRMISDVPLGAFLSGGVDSSGVVGLMARNSSKPVTTCSIGFGSKEHDEVAFANRIARQFATDHHELTVNENVEDNLGGIAAYFDEPFADPSLVPTYFVSKLARQHVTVALAGDGGDEAFAGYSKYVTDARENSMRRLLPGILRRLLPSIAGPLQQINQPLFRKGATLLTAISHEPAYGFFLTNSFFSEPLWEKIIHNSFHRALDSYHPSSITLEHYQRAPAHDHLSRILYTDIKTYLPGDILVKVDRMSMANSLEVRAPLLDYQIMEFAASIPSALKLHGGDKKHILKQAFSRILDHETLYRKKQGFSVPLAGWLRRQLKEQAAQLLFHSRAGLPEYFQMQQIRHIWELHQAGKRDYSSELWSMVMFQLWHNRYMTT